MKWTEHVKEYATRKGISYKDALKDSECKETYHKQKTEKPPTVEQGNKALNKRRYTKKLLNFGEETIEIPREMALNNNPVETLTKTKVPRRRKINGQITPAIHLEPIDGNEINIASDMKSNDMKHTELKDELKTRIKAKKFRKAVFGL